MLAVLAAVVALTMVGFGTVALLDLAARQTTTERASYDGVRVLELDGTGDVRITGAPAGSPVRVVLRVTEGLRSPERRAERSDGGTLRLSSSCPTFFTSQCAVRYDVSRAARRAGARRLGRRRRGGRGPGQRPARLARHLRGRRLGDRPERAVRAPALQRRRRRRARPGLPAGAGRARPRATCGCRCPSRRSTSTPTAAPGTWSSSCPTCSTGSKPTAAPATSTRARSGSTPARATRSARARAPATCSVDVRR